MCSHGYLSFPLSMVKDAYELLLSNPNKADLNLLGDMKYDTGDELICMANPKSLLYYVCHPKSFYSDLKDAPWRIGFIKRLFKVPLNYGKIYSFVRSISGKDT